jgi:PST family polysaccharide transporter
LLARGPARFDFSRAVLLARLDPDVPRLHVNEPSTPGDVEQRAVRGGAITGVAHALRVGVEATASVFLARVLSPADFGAIDMIVSITGIIDLLKDFGLSSATIQKETLEDSQVSLLFWINLGMGAALTVVTAMLAPLLAAGYDRPDLLKYALALSFTTLLGAASVQHQALLRRELKLGRLAAVDTTSSLIACGCAIAAAHHGWGVWALVLRPLIRLGSQTLGTWLVSSWRPSRPRSAKIAELLRFGTHLSGFQVMNYLERNLDNVLIGRFVGAEALGFYTKAYELMRLPLSQINAPIATVVVPALSRLVDHRERYRRAYLSVARLLMMATVPLGPLTIQSAHWVVPSLLGPQWEPSVPLFQCLAVGLIIKPLLNTTSWLFVSQGRSQDLWRWGVTGSAVALVSFLLGLPWGALGVAVSYTVIDLLVRAPMLLFWVGRAGPISARDLLKCARPAWLFAATSAAVYWTAEQGLTSLAVGPRTVVCSVSAWLLGLFVALLSPSGREAWHDLAEMLHSLRAERGPPKQLLHIKS